MNPFTPRAQQVLALARREADRFRHNYIGAEHILLGLLQLEQGVAISVLEAADVNIADLRTRIEKNLVPGTNSNTEGNLPYTPRVKKILSMAGKEAQNMNHSYIGTEHILLAIIRDGEGLAWHVLAEAGLTYEQIRQGVLHEINPRFTASIDDDDSDLKNSRDDEEEEEEEPTFLRRSDNEQIGRAHV